MENISEHISYQEATHSATAVRRGINNTPNAEQLAAMKLLAEKVLEPVRNHFGKPIKVNSFFRSKTLNAAVGGKKNSQHLKGEAADVVGVGYTNKELFDYIKNNLEWDQLIHEGGTIYDPAWVHVSYSAKGNRNQVLILL